MRLKSAVRDTAVIARLKAAGAIILGKSNLAELAGDFQSVNSLFPRVNNPWNLSQFLKCLLQITSPAPLLPLPERGDFKLSVELSSLFVGIFPPFPPLLVICSQVKGKRY